MTMQTDLTALIEKLEGLLAKATRGPWEHDSILDPDAEYGAGPDPDSGFRNYEIYGADGLKILGTEDAAHKEIEAESDEEGYLYAWDRVGLANVKLVLELVNNAPTLLALARSAGVMRSKLQQIASLSDEAYPGCAQHLARAAIQGDGE